MDTRGDMITEQYIIDNAVKLGYTSASNLTNVPKGSLIFKDQSVSTPEILIILPKL